MTNVYSKFMGKYRGTRVSEMWANGQNFSVRRAPAEVGYGRTKGGFDAPSSTSLIDPPDFDEVMMATPNGQLPPMPEIGRPESYYAQLVHLADREGSTHLHEAAKVGQYITLALDPHLPWDAKLKYFKHALKRHCSPPPYPDDNVWLFYQNLADLVRSHCGNEALRLASIEDDLYASRQRMGQTRHNIDNDAELFFSNLMGSSSACPEWFNENEWSQLKMLRDQWI